MVTEEQVLSALKQVEDPELNRDVVSLGMVRDIRVEGESVHFTFALTTAACPLREQLVRAVRNAVSALKGVNDVQVNVTEMTPEERNRALRAPHEQEHRPHPDNHVRHVIAVMSGKGGVGKSTVAALLAVALRQNGKSVGILDADITGPSIPKMFFSSLRRPMVTEEGLVPTESNAGVKIMSINLLLSREDEAVIWRGPLISGAIRQFWEEVVWGDLDYLVVDLPPGTSDASLTVMQSIPLNGVVLVTSPQSLAGMVVRKAASMAQHLKVPIVGIIENMAFFRCPHCGNESELFGPSHAEEVVRGLHTELLGRLPITPDLASHADRGNIEQCLPPEFREIADRLIRQLPETQTEPMMAREGR